MSAGTDVHPHNRFHGEEWHTPKGRLIREVVFGMNDGLVTTIAFVAGLTHFDDARVVVLAGCAEMIAGAVSMGFGSYISTKSQRDFFRAEIAREKREIRDTPDHEADEARQIYTEMGFTPDEVEIIVRRLRANPKLFLEMMKRHELGISDEHLDPPLKSAVAMGIAFVLGAIPPLVPYLFIAHLHTALAVALALSLASMFAIGAGRTRVTRRPFFRSGMEGVAFGVTATAIGYLGGLATTALLH